MLYLEARIAGKPVRWPVRDGDHIVGRDEACGLYVDDQSISRRHLRIAIRHGAATVEDLGSTNGLFVGGEKVAQAQVQYDQWFVAGNVLMSIREGLSLTSDSSATSGRPGNGAPATTEIPAEEPQDDHWARALASAVGQEESIDAMVLAALRCVGQMYRAFGAAFIESSGNGWIAHALWGSPPPQGLEERLSALDGQHPEVIEIEGSHLLCHPVWHRAVHEGWVIVHPWKKHHHRGPEFPLLIAWCRCLLEAQPAADVSPSGALAHPTDPGAAHDYVAVAEASRKLLIEADQIASTSISVLLQGETGVGKELLARRVHERSGCADGPFVVINCSAIPRELLEAELFGIQRGTATGVDGRAGRFLAASGGTLFLDEVGELPLEVQPKLLRALECGEVLPLGAPAAIPVRTRIVSATLRDLDQDVKNGRFRADLRYRLEGAVLRVASLRERPEDILPLVRLFARAAAQIQGQRAKGLDMQAARILLGYDWPGNARELRNVIFRAVALATDSMIHPDLFPASVRRQADLTKGDTLLGLRDTWNTAKTRFERLYFSQLLERSDGSVTKAALLSGMNRTNLYRKLEELGLRKTGES